jgi:uncharacterized protein YndB with AHSA1/START domain
MDAPHATARRVAGEIVVTRDIAAPRERVFAAWIDERLAARWWAPRDFMPLSCTIDPRPGGVWHRRMRAPDGTVIVKHGVYREIVSPQRLVFTYMTEDGDGAIDRETLVTVTFDDLGKDGPSNRTRLTLRHTAFASEEARLDHQGGWIGCLERCAAFFDAERDAA